MDKVLSQNIKNYNCLVGFVMFVIFATLEYFIKFDDDF